MLELRQLPRQRGAQSTSCSAIYLYTKHNWAHFLGESFCICHTRKLISHSRLSSGPLSIHIHSEAPRIIRKVAELSVIELNRSQFGAKLSNIIGRLAQLMQFSVNGSERVKAVSLVGRGGSRVLWCKKDLK